MCGVIHRLLFDVEVISNVVQFSPWACHACAFTRVRLIPRLSPSKSLMGPNT